MITNGGGIARKWLNESYGQGETYVGNRASGLLYDFLKALGKEGTGVILPASSCHALAQTVILAQYIPVFADIEVGDLNISISTLLVAHVNSKCEVSVCIAVHSYGNYCNLGAIQEYCSQKEIILVEDACQLSGSGYEGRTGDVVLTSFGYSKPINIGGGGGLIIRSPLLQKIGIKMRRSKEYEPFFEAQGAKFKSDYYLMRNRERMQEIPRGSLQALTRVFSDFILHGGSVPHWDKFGEQISSLNERNDERCCKAEYLRHELLTIPGLRLLDYAPASIPWRFSFMVKNPKHQMDLTSALRSNIQHVSNWYPNLALDFRGDEENQTSNATMVEGSILNIWIDDLADTNYLSKAIETIHAFFNKRVD